MRNDFGPKMEQQKSERSQGPLISVQDLVMAYGSRVIQENLTFTVHRGDVFIIMGGSGCGKSTLLRHLIGLQEPSTGKVVYGNRSLWGVDASERDDIMRNCGILYQSGALWSSMTLAENVSLPLEEYTNLQPQEIREIAELKLALVGLAGFEDYYPSEISGGMKKRAGLARALALDPEILFFDEPSAGLDPVSAKLLDDLIMELRDSLSATIVIVTHELESIFAIGNNSVFLDAQSRTMIAQGDPKMLLRESNNQTVRNFLTRGRVQGSDGECGSPFSLEGGHYRVQRNQRGVK
jgi:phospholipid/cholesterol/gamma-HCH transport system ATP-binding protein